MKLRKTCVYCHCLFEPYPARYQRQKACSKPSCQRQRRRDTNRRNHAAHRYDSDYRWGKKKAWRQRYGRDYMRHYRQTHFSYLKRNRCQQRKRNHRKRRMIVKSDLWTSLHSGKLVRIRILESDCKERLMRLLPPMKNRVSGVIVKSDL